MGSAGEIVVLSLVPSPPPAARVPDDPWPISWPGIVPGSDGRAQLHATSLRRGLFYRMDASAPLASGRYEWATDVVRGLTLRAEEISLRAETKVKIGTITWPALLPVGIGRDSRAAADFTVMLTTTVPLYAVTWECLRMTTAGMPGVAVAQGRRQGPFKADEPFGLPLAMRGYSGFCSLELSGEAVTRPPSGEPSASAVLFLPGAPSGARGTRP